MHKTIHQRKIVDKFSQFDLFKKYILQYTSIPSLQCTKHFIFDLLSYHFLLSWTINMQGAEGTLYDGEQFQLQFKFGTSYPFESPEVNYL